MGIGIGEERGPSEAGRWSAGVWSPSVLFVLVVAGVVLLGARIGGAVPQAEGPDWGRALPPETVAVVRLQPGALGRFAEAISDRLGLSHGERWLAADDPVSAVVGGMVTGSIESTLRAEPDRWARWTLEHLDRERPVIVALRYGASTELRRRMRLGLPPTRPSILGIERGVRLLIPSTDAAALADELESLCGGTRPRGACEPEIDWRTAGGWVWVDTFAPNGDGAATASDEPAEGGNVRAWSVDEDVLQPTTPAVRALLRSEAGVAVYAPAEIVRRLRHSRRAGSLNVLAERLRSSTAKYAPFRVRALREEIAEMLAVEASRSPGTREIQDTTFLFSGTEEGRFRLDAVQSYTSYGAEIADAGRIDLALPLLEAPRSVISGMLRFDVASSLEAAALPSWMDRPVAASTTWEHASRLARAGEGTALLSAVLTQPISTLRAAVALLESDEAPTQFSLGPFLDVAGASYVLDVGASRLLEDGFGLRGGVALAFTRPEAVRAYLDIVDLVQAEFGVPIQSKREERDGFTYLELRVDTSYEFATSDRSSSTPVEGSLGLDRMLAKLEVLGRGSTGISVGRTLLRFFDGVSYRVDAGTAGRVVSIGTEGVDPPDVELDRGRSHLGMPRSPPQCLSRVVDGSMRLYISEIAATPAGSSPPLNGEDAESAPLLQPGREGERPNVELSTGDRRAIRDFVGSLEALRQRCRRVGEGWGGRVEMIRDYWRRVLEGKVATYPAPSGASGEGEVSE